MTQNKSAHNKPEMTPQETVAALDKYVVGQKKAKRAVAIAIRNRYRRRQVKVDMREDIRPKNLLLIGPTGVGKTEIARRLSKISNAPFVKVEATKFTEVGYMGRDVDSMVRDLIEVSINLIKKQRRKELEPIAKKQAHERILDILLPDNRKEQTLDDIEKGLNINDDMPIYIEEKVDMSPTRQKLSAQLSAGKFDDKEIEIEVNETQTPVVEVISNQSGFEEMGINMQSIQSMLGNMMPTRQRKQIVKVSEAKEMFFQEEMNELLEKENIQKEAIRIAEENGIVFLDEFDKIASSFVGKSGPDVSREGVQRDLLPLVEGTTVMTKYGMIRTDHILFFAAGAFNVSKPSDLIPELQGRFPVRVEFDRLGVEDFKRILTEPNNALTKQYKALMSVDGLDLTFSDGAIEKIAEYACEANDSQENIGARRLHTIMEHLMDEVAFEAPQNLSGAYEINSEKVDKIMKPLMKDRNLAKFIL